ncbi:MAG: NADH-quinone oxidoreductase subunit J [Chloroflexi bacterium]|nr:NADH-quinone oxidoreductase subunit J [Chloroflexota bacterium]
MEDTGTVVAFWALAIITIGSAFMVAAVRNLIHAVVFLVLSFLGVAGLYITLSADFVGVVQILIYSGAIAILVIFAIVLTPQAGRDNAETSMRLPAVVLSGLVATMLGYASIDTNWSISDRPGFEETASAIGVALLDKYILPFEIAAALMLVAMLGAIIIVRDEGTEGAAED